MARVPLVLTSALLPLLLAGVTQAAGVDRDVEQFHSPYVSTKDLGPKMTAHNGQPLPGPSLHDPKTQKSKKSIESLPQADAAAYGCSSCGSSFDNQYVGGYNSRNSFGSLGGLPRSTSTRQESRSEQRFVNGQQVYDLKHSRRYHDGQLVQDDRRELDEDDFGVPQYTNYGVYGYGGGAAGSVNSEEYNYHQSSSSTGFGQVPNSLPSMASASSSASSSSSISSDGSYGDFRSEVERLREELHRNTQSMHGSTPGVGGSHRTEYRYETRYVNGKPVYIRNEEKKYKDGQLVHDMTEEKGPEDLGTEHLVSDHDQGEVYSQTAYGRPGGYSRTYHSERNEEYGVQNVGQTHPYPSNTYPQGSYPQGSYPQGSYPQGTYPQGTNLNYNSEASYQSSVHSSVGQDTYRTPSGSYPSYRPRTPSTDYSPSSYDSHYSAHEDRTSYPGYPSTSSLSQVSQETRESSYTGQYDGSHSRPQTPYQPTKYGEASSVTQVSRDDTERTTSSPAPVSTQVSSYNTYQGYDRSYDQSYDQSYDHGYDQFPTSDDTDHYPPPSENSGPATYGSSSHTSFEEAQTHRQTSYPSSVSHTPEYRGYKPAPGYTSPTRERQPKIEVPQTPQREPTYPYKRPTSSQVEQETQYTSSVVSNQHSSPYGRTPNTPYQGIPDDIASPQHRPESQGPLTAVSEREETYQQAHHGYQPQSPEVSTQISQEASRTGGQQQIYHGYQPQRPGTSPRVHDSTRSTVERQQTYRGYQPQSPVTSTHVTHESSRTSQERQSTFSQTPDQARTTTFDLTNSHGTDTSISDRLLGVNTVGRQDTYENVDEEQQTSTGTRVVQGYGSQPDSTAPHYPHGPQGGSQLTYEERRRQHQEWYGRDQYDRTGATQVQTGERVDSAGVDSSQEGYSVIPGVIRGPETSSYYPGNEEADKERYDISPFDDDNGEGGYLGKVDNEIVTNDIEDDRHAYESSHTSSQTTTTTTRGSVPTTSGTAGYDQTQVTTSYTPAASSHEDRQSHTSVTQEQHYIHRPVQVGSSYSNYSYSQQHSSGPGPDTLSNFPVSSSVSTSEESQTTGSLLPQTSDQRTEFTTRRKFVNGHLVSEQHFERRFQNGELVHENRTNLSEDELQRSAALDSSINREVYNSYPYTSQAQRHELHQVKKFINGQQVYELHHERQFQDGGLVHENKTEKNADDFDATNLARTGHEVTQQQHLQQHVYTDGASYGGTPGVSNLATEERHVTDSKDFIITPKYYTRRSEVRQQKEYVNGHPVYNLHHEKRFEDGQLVHENKTEQTEEDLQGKEVHEDALHAILAGKLAMGSTGTAESGGYYGGSQSQTIERQEQYQESVHGDTSGHLVKGCLTCVLTAGPSTGMASSSSSSSAASSSSSSSYIAGSPILGHLGTSEVVGEGGYSQKTEHTQEEHYENGALVEGKEKSRKWQNGQLVHEKSRQYSGDRSHAAQIGQGHQQSPYTQSSPYQARGHQGRLTLRQGVGRGHSRATGDTEGACASNPCRNGGTCKQRGENAYTCVCKFGFKGSVCQEAYCPIRFCRHGGECNIENGRHVCTCRQGYSGERCGSKRRGGYHSRRHSTRA